MIETKLLKYTNVLSTSVRTILINYRLGDLARHALPVALPTEKNFAGSEHEKQRKAAEGLTRINSPEEQKAFIEENSKELAKLFQELEAHIDNLPDMERSEEDLVREMERIESDNKASLAKLETVRETAGIFLQVMRVEKASETITVLMHELETDKEGYFMHGPNNL